MSIYPAGQQPLSSLTGAEQVRVDNGGATIVYATTQQIANLAATGANSAITALNTVGAGTITAAGIIGGITARGGSQSNTAFTDTTATGAQLDAALIDPQVGQSWEWTYENTTNATATLQGGSGVTVSGITAVPGGTQARFLVTRTGTATYTVVGFLQTPPTTASGTFIANGATAVVVADTRITANSTLAFAMKTVGGTPAGAPFLSAVTPGTGFSVKVAAGDTSTYNYTIIG